MFEALLAWVAAWLRRRFARAQRTAALAEPVQDRLATLLAPHDEFLKQMQRHASEQETRHAPQIARLDAKHQEQMARKRPKKKPSKKQEVLPLWQGGCLAQAGWNTVAPLATGFP